MLVQPPEKVSCKRATSEKNESRRLQLQLHLFLCMVKVGGKFPQSFPVYIAMFTSTCFNVHFEASLRK